MAALGDRRCESHGYFQAFIGHSKVQKRIHEIRINLGPQNSHFKFFFAKLHLYLIKFIMVVTFDWLSYNFVIKSLLL